MLIATVLAAVLAWTVIFYVGYRRIGGAAHKAVELELKFRLKSAPWSDTYVELLLVLHPDSPALLCQDATNAIEKKNWPEGLRRAERFGKRAPSDPKAWIMRVDVLRNMGRTQEADAVLQRARWRIWSDVGIELTWARQAVQREAWQQAGLRYARLRRRFPDKIEGYTEGVAVMIRQERLEAAEAVIRTGLLHRPEWFNLWRSAATLAEHRGQTGEAIGLWEEIRRRFPTEPSGFLRGAAALQRVDRHAEAEQLLRQGGDFFPGNRLFARALEPAAEAGDRPAS